MERLQLQRAGSLANGNVNRTCEPLLQARPVHPGLLSTLVGAPS